MRSVSTTGRIKYSEGRSTLIPDRNFRGKVCDGRACLRGARRRKQVERQRGEGEVCGAQRVQRAQRVQSVQRAQRDRQMGIEGEKEARERCSDTRARM